MHLLRLGNITATIKIYGIAREIAEGELKESSVLRKNICFSVYLLMEEQHLMQHVFNSTFLIQ